MNYWTFLFFVFLYPYILSAAPLITGETLNDKENPPEVCLLEMLKEDGSLDGYCSGTAVEDSGGNKTSHIVSAAHCFADLKAENIVKAIRVRCPNQDPVFVKNIYIHPLFATPNTECSDEFEYYESGYRNLKTPWVDLSVLSLNKPIPIKGMSVLFTGPSLNFDSINLVSSKDLYSLPENKKSLSRTFRVSGYGRDNKSQHFSNSFDDPRDLTERFHTAQVENRYLFHADDYLNFERLVFYGDFSILPGDSGGAFYEIINGKRYLLGVNSTYVASLEGVLVNPNTASALTTKNYAWLRKAIYEEPKTSVDVFRQALFEVGFAPYKKEFKKWFEETNNEFVEYSDHLLSHVKTLKDIYKIKQKARRDGLPTDPSAFLDYLLSRVMPALENIKYEISMNYKEPSTMKEIRDIYTRRLVIYGQALEVDPILHSELYQYADY